MPLKKNSNKRHQYPYFEDDIQFKLHRVGGIKSKATGNYKYAASLQHDEARDIGDSRDLNHIDRHLGTLPVSTAISQTTELLNAMAELVMRDGITRRLGDLLEMRLEIKGSFDRPDEAFNPYKHRLQLKIVPLNGLNLFSRKDPPLNVQKRPRGRIDAVTFEGGEIGKVKVGADIIITGKDLKFLAGDYLRLDYQDPEGEYRRVYCNFDPERNPFIVNTDSMLRVKWFGPKSFNDVKYAKMTLFVNPWSPHHSNPTKRGATAALTLIP
jgi:hypothetical protein